MVQRTMYCTLNTSMGVQYLCYCMIQVCHCMLLYATVCYCKLLYVHTNVNVNASLHPCVFMLQASLNNQVLHDFPHDQTLIGQPIVQFMWADPWLTMVMIHTTINHGPLHGHPPWNNPWHCSWMNPWRTPRLSTVWRSPRTDL